MQTTHSLNLTTTLLVPLGLGLLAALIVSAALAGKTLPLISGPKAALLALLVVGMAMCSGGIGQVGASGRWASPLAITGYILGALLLVVIAAGLFGWKLPLVQDERQAVAAVAGLMAVKFVLGTAGYFLHLL